MNKDRRKALADIENKLEELKEELEPLRDEEQEYYDNMPDSLQMSEKGEVADQAIENMSNALDQIEEAITGIQNAQE